MTDNIPLIALLCTTVKGTRYLLAAVFLATPVLAGNDPVAEIERGQPKPVVDFIDGIVGCNHWQDEEPYHADRACVGTEQAKHLTDGDSK
jgi:hypothetical protein